MNTATITIDPAGTVRFVHDDELQPLLVEGRGTMRRASHVEPTADNRWDADMSPVGGPASLGPFDTRGQALAAERDWLERNWL